MERGPGFGRDMLGGMGEMHPIRVIGHNWFDRDPTNLEWRMDSMSREGFDVAAGLGIDMGGEGTGR